MCICDEFVMAFLLCIRYLATTQMQPTDARKTFPCFDEPGVKATFGVTLQRQSHLKTLSNMDINKTDTM